jgi:hypothetical protein
VRFLRTSQIRLFEPDVVPLAKLSVAEYRDKIISAFRFNTVEPIVAEGNEPGIRFGAGAHGDKPEVIESIQIEARRVLIHVLAPTSTTTAVYQKLATMLSEFNDGKPFTELICTHETLSSVVLDVHFYRVLSEQFLSFIQGPARQLNANEWSENYILPEALRFSVRYKLTDTKLIEHRIGLSPKELAIEPAPKIPVDERVFRVKTPTDSDTHFAMIREFERALSV